MIGTSSREPPLPNSSIPGPAKYTPRTKIIQTHSPRFSIVPRRPIFVGDSTPREVGPGSYDTPRVESFKTPRDKQKSAGGKGCPFGRSPRTVETEPEVRMPTRRDEPESLKKNVPPKYSFARTGRGGDNQSVRAEAVGLSFFRPVGTVRLPELPTGFRPVSDRSHVGCSTVHVTVSFRLHRSPCSCIRVMSEVMSTDAQCHFGYAFVLTEIQESSIRKWSSNVCTEAVH